MRLFLSCVHSWYDFVKSLFLPWLAGCYLSLIWVIFQTSGSGGYPCLLSIAVGALAPAVVELASASLQQASSANPSLWSADQCWQSRPAQEGTAPALARPRRQAGQGSAPDRPDTSERGGAGDRGPQLSSSAVSTHSFSQGSHSDYADPFQTHLEPRGFATNTFKTVSS